jgi:hypothetical protein
MYQHYGMRKRSIQEEYDLAHRSTPSNDYWTARHKQHMRILLVYGGILLGLALLLAMAPWLLLFVAKFTH